MASGDGSNDQTTSQKIALITGITGQVFLTHYEFDNDCINIR